MVGRRFNACMTFAPKPPRRVATDAKLVSRSDAVTVGRRFKCVPPHLLSNADSNLEVTRIFHGLFFAASSVDLWMKSTIC